MSIRFPAGSMCGCALLSLLVTAAYGQETRLTLDRALLLADQFNPQLGVAGAEIGAARAGIVTARARPNPEINFLGGRQNLRLSSAVSGVLQHWGYTQLLELPKIRNLRIEAARIGEESSEYFLEETKLVVRGAVKQAFFQVLRRRGEVELAQETLRLVEDLRERVGVQVKVGEVGRLELTRAEAEEAQARTFFRSAQLREVTAVAELRALVSAPLPDNISAEGNLDPPLTLLPFDEVRSAVFARHPGIARAEAEVRRARARLEAETSLRTPQPLLVAEYEQMPDLRFFRAGLAIPIPLLNRRQGPIAEAAALLSRAMSAASALRLEIVSTLERAYGEYQVSSQQVAAYEEGVLREAQAAVDAAGAAFRFGERGILEVLDSQRVLRNVRLDYLNAQYDRQAALIELERLRAINTGGNTP